MSTTGSANAAIYKEVMIIILPCPAQVSHHPPVCAAHAWNEHFAYDLVSAPTTRFLGNSLEVFPLGETLSGRDSGTTARLSKCITFFFQLFVLCEIFREPALCPESP